MFHENNAREVMNEYLQAFREGKNTLCLKDYIEQMHPALSKDIFVGANLTSMDLSGIDVSGINFSQADFNNTLLEITNFKNAIVTNAKNFNITSLALAIIDNVVVEDDNNKKIINAALKIQRLFRKKKAVEAMIEYSKNNPPVKPDTLTKEFIAEPQERDIDNANKQLGWNCFDEVPALYQQACDFIEIAQKAKNAKSNTEPKGYSGTSYSIIKEKNNTLESRNPQIDALLYLATAVELIETQPSKPTLWSELLQRLNQLLSSFNLKLQKANQDETLLHHFVGFKNVSLIRYLLSETCSTPQRQNLNAEKRFDRKTPLMIAVESGCMPVFQLLLNQPETDICVGALGENARTVLHVACQERRRDMTHLLVEHSCIKEIINSPLGKRYTPYSGYTALHFACLNADVELAKQLIKLGADCLQKNLIGETPLKTAFYSNSSSHSQYLERDELCLYLLEKSPLLDENSAWAFLLQAGEASLVATFKQLAQHPLQQLDSLKLKDIIFVCLNQLERLPFREVAYTGIILECLKRMQQIDCLYEHLSYNGTVLHRAAHLGLLVLVKALITEGLKSTLSERGQEYPLHRVARYSNDAVEVAQCLIDECPEAVTGLTGHLETALHQAARAGNVKIIQALLKANSSADFVNRQNEEGNTALHEVFEAYEFKRKSDIYSHIILYLLEAGIDIEIKNNDNITAKELAVKKGFVLQLNQNNILSSSTSLSPTVAVNNAQVKGHLIIINYTNVHIQPAVTQTHPVLVSHERSFAIRTHIEKCLKRAYENYNVIEPPLFEDTKEHRLTLKESYIKLTFIEGRVDNREQLQSKDTGKKKRESSYEGFHNPGKDKKNIEIRELFQRNSSNEDLTTPCKRVMVFGRAGFGKSTLLQYLAYLSISTDSLKKPAWLNQFSIVFHVRLRKIATFELVQEDRYKQLARFILHSLQLHLTLGIEDIALLLKGILTDDAGKPFKVCLLLDGLDEVRLWLNRERQSNDKCQILEDLLSLSASKEHIYTIVSSRPMNIPHSLNLYNEQNKECQTIEVMGFDDTAIELYIEEYFKSRSKYSKFAELGEELNRLLKQQPMAWGVAHIPVVLALICNIWSDTSQEMRKFAFKQQTTLSLTNIYSQLLIKLQRRLKQKVSAENSSSLRTSGEYISYAAKWLDGEFLKDDNIGMLFLYQLALEGTVNGDVIFHSSAVRRSLNKVGIPDDENEQRSFLNVLRETGLLNFEKMDTSGRFELPKDMYFLHLSIQEFLAAYAILYELREQEKSKSRNRTIAVWSSHEAKVVEYEIIDFIGRFKHVPSFEMVWPFVAGLLIIEQENQYPRRVKRLNEISQNCLKSFWDALYGLPNDLFFEADLFLLLRCLNEGQHEGMPQYSLISEIIEKWLWASLDGVVEIERYFNNGTKYIREKAEIVHTLFLRNPTFTDKLLKKKWEEVKNSLPGAEKFLHKIIPVIEGNDRIIEYFFTYQEPHNKIALFQLIPYFFKNENIEKYFKLLYTELKTTNDKEIRQKISRILENLNTKNKLTSQQKNNYLEKIWKDLDKRANYSVRDDLMAVFSSMCRRLPPEDSLKWVNRIWEAIEIPANRDIRQKLSWALNGAYENISLEQECDETSKATGLLGHGFLLLKNIEDKKNEDILQLLRMSLSYLGHKLTSQELSVISENIFNKVADPSCKNLGDYSTILINLSHELSSDRAHYWADKLWGLVEEKIRLPPVTPISDVVLYMDIIQKLPPKFSNEKIEEWFVRLLEAFENPAYQSYQDGLGYILVSVCNKLTESLAIKYMESILALLQNKNKNIFLKASFARAFIGVCGRTSPAVAREQYLKLWKIIKSYTGNDNKEHLAHALWKIYLQLNIDDAKKTFYSVCDDWKNHPQWWEENSSAVEYFLLAFNERISFRKIMITLLNEFKENIPQMISLISLFTQATHTVLHVSNSKDGQLGIYCIKGQRTFCFYASFITVEFLSKLQQQNTNLYLCSVYLHLNNYSNIFYHSAFSIFSSTPIKQIGFSIKTFFQLAEIYQHSSNTFNFHNIACYCWRIKEHEKAHALFKQGISLHPTQGIYVEYAHFLLTQNDPGQALNVLQKCIDKEPTNLVYNREENNCDTIIQEYLQKNNLAKIHFKSDELAYFLQIRCYQYLKQTHHEQAIEASKTLLKEKYPSSILIELAEQVAQEDPTKNLRRLTVFFDSQLIIQQNNSSMRRNTVETTIEDEVDDYDNIEFQCSLI